MKNLTRIAFIAFAMTCFSFLQASSQDIFTAVEEGDVLMTRQLLEKDPGLLNLKNPDKLTPLNLAAEAGQFAVAELLLSMGADPAIGDNENSQPIHLAALNGHINIVDLLLTHGVDIDTRDDNQMTPLLFAVSRGQMEMTNHLVEIGADVKAKNITGFNVLLMASISGNLDLVRLFVESGAHINARNNDGFTPLHSAASYGRTDVVKYLLDHGADIDAETNHGDQPLAMAAGRNSYEAAQCLILKGADINHKSNDGFTALHNVAGRGNVAIARLLIENGADINASTPDGIVPMTYAAWGDNAEEMVKLLILSGADVNPDPCKNIENCTCGPNFRTPLHAACDAAKPELVKILVNNGAKVNLYGSDGLTPLHYAVRSGNVDEVRCLIENGAFLNVKENTMGWTELHMAAAMGYGDVASLLMERGSSITAMDNAGKTPPDYAFYYGQEQIGFSMLAAGASDSSLVSYLKDECLLSKNIGMGEAEVIYLGHSGWAIKTQNHLLIFDYFDNPRSRKPDHECLKAGCILPKELDGQNVTVFSTHGHQDHFNKSYFDWDDNNSGVSYVFCHQPVGITDEYMYIPANGDTEVNGMKIYVNKSTDGGGGFFVETDGLVIFHMGDHANGDDALSVDFKREIDLIAQKGKDIDLLFGPIRGCSLGTPAQVKTGIYYTLETLHPNLFIPMHSGVYTYTNKSFTEQAQRDGITTTMKFAVARGDRFDYRKGEDVVLQNIDDQ